MFPYHQTHAGWLEENMGKRSDWCEKSASLVILLFVEKAVDRSLDTAREMMTCPQSHHQQTMMQSQCTSFHVYRQTSREEKGDYCK